MAHDAVKPEVAERLARLRSRMAATNTDLVALAPGAHLRWLLGFAPAADERASLCLIGQDEACFLMPALNADDSRQHTDLPFFEWKDETGPAKAFADALTFAAPRARRFALDETMRADHALMLTDALAGCARSFASDTVGALRMIKSADEIARLRDNARIADLAQVAVRAALAEGMSETDLARVVQEAFAAEGAKPTFAILAFGPNSAYPHHHTGATRLTRGDVVLVDIGGLKDGYNSDITRMASFGEPPAGYRDVHWVVDAAVRAAMAAARPGVQARSVDLAARQVISDAGYGAYFTHRTGHGLGTEVHEQPYITSANDLVLEEGMVFTIEPGIYLPGRFGIRLEEVAVVTANGCEILSGLSRDLAVV
ncbi:M24 family metallopeptidase [Pannonibacter tanglangensis]|uniref:M24 family metallopeptidase n=1 Tax=Pannonibacter tanglangensis TaxID=2750084 RepID=A0ABW9ZLK6_9HYPH|nr:Xaa-Pro peptidase family protein [Pannonibacter sp. XCT-34]NBN63914.1 M24 family metallopeptidase [Pannonibacter sp. XCT-34]